jgi:hypothetical protein
MRLAAQNEAEANLQVDRWHPKRAARSGSDITPPGVYFPSTQVLTSGSRANFRKGFYREE